MVLPLALFSPSLSTSAGVPGTVADAAAGLAVDALISGQFPFSLAPHTVGPTQIPLPLGRYISQTSNSLLL